MMRFFERRVDPYPDAPPSVPPRGFIAFLWACTQGLRRYLLGMTLLSALIGVFEAALFALLGHIVDTLVALPREQLWSAGGTRLAGHRRGAPRQHRARGAADHDQAPEPRRQFPHAAALELPPPDAGAEPDLLPG